MARITINPTSSGLWHVEGGGFGDLLRRARECEEWATAADMRFEGVQRLHDEDERWRKAACHVRQAAFFGCPPVDSVDHAPPLPLKMHLWNGEE